MIQSLAGLLTGKWKAELIFYLKDRPLRLGELEWRIPGANPRVLKRQLRILEANGIVQRKTYSEAPPRVEYSLTEKGQALFPLMESIDQTIKEYMKNHRL